MTTNDDSTRLDDTSIDVGQNQDNTDDRNALLANVLKNSDFFNDEEKADLDLPVPEIDGPVEADDKEEDLEESDDIVTDEDTGEGEVPEEEAEETDEDDDESTQQDVYDVDELDDFNVKVKIDGEESEVDIKELVKGYQTDQYLTKKGRELSEANQHFERIVQEKYGEIESLGEQAAAIVQSSENSLAKRYHALEAEIDAARRAGDNFKVGELKDQRELAQKNYWNARKRREGIEQTIDAKRNEVAQQQMSQAAEHFNNTILDHVPHFDADHAEKLKNFALDHGIPEVLISNTYSPELVAFVDEFYNLKNGVTKGAAKRKQAPVQKALPKRKATPAKKKKEEAAERQRKKVLSGNASEAERRNFLTQKFASKHFG